ncbi:alpha/beta hydrolase [Synechococcales cyanobacterium C]|uniref:Alpha/beta hydrolase n=1 Tax=Petrachloros mirabilis ULC683 TaxID=2781853 RepID=A0A8K1ZY00_9CYAN|nr:alpha/beta hydrolase [Petrachloros mirabilis]NCJ05722.1 alpha/beta hydrolase [Petrachloros mirabilis ULC683]
MLTGLKHWLVGISGTLMVLGVGATTQPSVAAEKISIFYGPFGRSVSVSDLRQFAETEVAPPDLAALLRLVSTEQRASLLKGLQTKFPFDVRATDQLLRSPLGEPLLNQVAEVTRLPGGAEKQAMRGALIVAAASPEGLGVITFLEAYPTPTMTVDLRKALQLLESTDGLGTLLQQGLGQ